MQNVVMEKDFELVHSYVRGYRLDLKLRGTCWEKYLMNVKGGVSLSREPLI